MKRARRTSAQFAACVAVVAVTAGTCGDDDSSVTTFLAPPTSTSEVPMTDPTTVSTTPPTSGTTNTDPTTVSTTPPTSGTTNTSRPRDDQRAGQFGRPRHVCRRLANGQLSGGHLREWPLRRRQLGCTVVHGRRRGVVFSRHARRRTNEPILDALAAKGFNTVLVNIVEVRYSNHTPVNATATAHSRVGSSSPSPTRRTGNGSTPMSRRPPSAGSLSWRRPPTWASTQMVSALDVEASTNEQMLEYGRFLGTRYANAPNIIWVIGGDRTAVSDEQFERMDSMATGIQETAPQLITGHTAQNATAADVFGSYHGSTQQLLRRRQRARGRSRSLVRAGTYPPDILRRRDLRTRARRPA